MENSVSKISKVLLDLSRVADVVLYPTRKGNSAASSKELDPGQRCLLERIDGFRSLEQVLSMSGDIIGVHASLGKLIALGFVTTDASLVNAEPAAPIKVEKIEKTEKVEKAVKAAPLQAAAKVAAVPVSAKPAVKTPPAPVAKPAAPAVAAASSEIENAKRLLLLEAKLALGDGAAKLAPRVVACTTIEEVYDLIVKFQQHLAKTGKADPDVFLERLSKGLASGRNQSAAAKQRPVA
jgi:hypothetical protein